MFTIDGPDAHDVCAPSLPSNVEREYEAGKAYFHISTIRLPMHCEACEKAKAKAARRGKLTLVK